MSVSLTIRWVFGYYDPTGESFGLGTEYEDPGKSGVIIEPASCMTGDGGTLVYATGSAVEHLNDRDGYEFEGKEVMTIDMLPNTKKFITALERAIKKAPEERRPKIQPQWILHTDVG